MRPIARVARASAAFVCSNLARAAIGLVLALVLSRTLGPARFGGWILCTAWASTLTVVVDLGFGVLLTRDGARDAGDPAELLAGALAWRLAAALPLGGALAAFASLLSGDAEVVAAMRAAAALGAAGAAYGCFGSLLRSQPRWLPVVLGVETLWLAVQALASWRLVAAGAGLTSLVALAAALQGAQIATALVLWRSVFGERSARPFVRPRRMVPLVLRALPFAASGLVVNLQARLGPMMLGALATPTDIGWFGAASRVGRGVRLVPQAVFAGALPVLTQEYGRDAASATTASRDLDRALAALSVAAAVSCGLLAPIVMPLVFGAPFGGAVPTLVWVAVGLIPALSNSGRKIFLYAAGMERRVVGWSAVALAMQALAGAVLIPRLGSAGAAIAMAAAEAIVWLPLRRPIPLRSAMAPPHTVGVAPAHSA